jgi:hypothetical protein
MKKKKERELLIMGITPEELEKTRKFFIVHKSAKKGNSSFQITKALLDSLDATSLKINKKARLIISINNFILTCDVSKESN